MITVGDNLALNRGGVSSMVDAFAARVVTNGGTAVTAGQKAALTTFYNGLGTDAILSKMVAVCCFIPGAFSPAIADGDLIRACTPLIVGPGNDPWTTVNFAAGDLTTNGLTGNGTDKYLRTGVVPTTAFADDTSGGLSIYNISAVNAASYEIGAWNSSAQDLVLISSYSSTVAFFESWNETADQGRVSAVNDAFAGFVSGSRTSSIAAALYRANSVTSPTQLAISIGAANGTRPSVEVLVFALNQNGGAAAFSARQLSFAAIHKGLSYGETSKFYTRVQAMRTALGGGYV